jgi:DNA invertase Pin-like site-specific DNA recombinase
MTLTPSPQGRAVGRAAKADRAEEMLAAFNAGLTPREIAEDFGVTVRCVYVRLTKQGVTFDNEKRRGSVMWDLPEDDRRFAIAQRAAHGAREALKAQS